MNNFDKYIEKLADHEDRKYKSINDPRKRILVDAGIGLNWLGDYLSNPNIEYKKINLSIYKVLFTGTSPEWNKILIDRCERSAKKFQKLIDRDKSIKKKFIHKASYGLEPILVRHSDKKGYYKVLDGMHRFIGAVIKKRRIIKAFIPINEDEHLPICEAHVVYDLIRGVKRHAADEQGEAELYHSLKLLARTYENVTYLLKNRFNSDYVVDERIQKIIKKVIRETRYHNNK